MKVLKIPGLNTVKNMSENEIKKLITQMGDSIGAMKEILESRPPMDLSPFIYVGDRKYMLFLDEENEITRHDGKAVFKFFASLDEGITCESGGDGEFVIYLGAIPSKKFFMDLINNGKDIPAIKWGKPSVGK